ncbi:hypothetical protein [Pseudovibrio sp. POLY-S9]|uniref:hypothetical protein n=1 Tax=Pseudovibrio sp. POLY-S9 TaxID=1576596 RepID=UPI00070D4732|nr:hypothetical protein [Pseudovibrio sp. POLY-S9]
MSDEDDEKYYEKMEKDVRSLLILSIYSVLSPKQQMDVEKILAEKLEVIAEFPNKNSLHQDINLEIFEHHIEKLKEWQTQHLTDPA